MASGYTRTNHGLKGRSRGSTVSVGSLFLRIPAIPSAPRLPPPVQISSLLESLAAETRFATYFENGGVDIGHIARSISGRTAGEMVDGVRVTAGKVGAQAQRLRTEALRWRKVKRRKRNEKDCSWEELFEGCPRKASGWARSAWRILECVMTLSCCVPVITHAS